MSAADATFETEAKTSPATPDRRQILILDKLAEYGRRLNIVEVDVGVLKTGGIATRPLWLIALSVGAGVGVHSSAMAVLVYLAWTWHAAH